jgi:hypothetical protein
MFIITYPHTSLVIHSIYMVVSSLPTRMARFNCIRPLLVSHVFQCLFFFSAFFTLYREWKILHGSISIFLPVAVFLRCRQPAWPLCCSSLHRYAYCLLPFGLAFPGLDTAGPLPSQLSYTSPRGTLVHPRVLSTRGARPLQWRVPTTETPAIPPTLSPKRDTYLTRGALPSRSNHRTLASLEIGPQQMLLQGLWPTGHLSPCLGHQAWSRLCIHQVATFVQEWIKEIVGTLLRKNGLLLH